MLKYLFRATFADDSIIQQTQDDVSPNDPKRSQFFDVLEKAKTTPLTAFVLVGEGHEYGVDLRDGHFEIDGVPFRFHEDEDYKDFRIVFWRRHRHHIEVSIARNKEVGHEIAYRIGWQCTVKGKNYEEIMQID